MIQSAALDVFLTYRFHLKDKTFEYRFEQTKCGIRPLNTERAPVRPWQNLSHEQCPHCPLNIESNSCCPLARNLAPLLDDWQSAVSYETLKIEVHSHQRTTIADTTVQKGLSSLLGLFMATSDCPHTQFFQPMAQFHLPLASGQETVYRAVSTYLLTQYFRHQNNENIRFDLEGLKKIYDQIHILNVHMKKRLMSAIEEDAALNAMVILDLFAVNIPNFLAQELNQIKPFFSILLNDNGEN